VEPYGIKTTIVEPGFFRTELLVEGSSTIWAEKTIDDYAERTERMKAMWRKTHGQQAGDPAKLGAALVQIAESDEPPFRFVAGADAVAAIEQKMYDVPRPDRRHPRPLDAPRPRRRLSSMATSAVTYATSLNTSPGGGPSAPRSSVST
jgi:NAD(P)-dependent dehydrogenase (short-subunit alcohol dehydrogenase family)